MPRPTDAGDGLYGARNRWGSSLDTLDVVLVGVLGFVIGVVTTTWLATMVLGR